VGSYSVHVGGFSIAFEAFEVNACCEWCGETVWWIEAPQMEEFEATTLDVARDKIRAHYLNITNTIDPGDYL
jgi:hypothetical protein